MTNTIFLYSWQVSYPPLPPRRRGGWGGGGLGRLTISAITYEKWYKVKLKVYLDRSVLNRIFDDQTQARIYLESISMQLIFLLVENETIEIISSDALVYETQRNPDSNRRTFVELVLQQARHFQLITEEVLARSQPIETSARIKGVDALHIACAEAIEADYFITCEGRMIKKYSGTLAVKTPVEFVAIIFNA